MGDAALAEKRAFALEGAVDELVDQYEGSRRQYRPERSTSRKRDQVGHAGALEYVDVGPVVDVGRRQPMALVMPRQKDDRKPCDRTAPKRRGRLAPGAGDRLFAGTLEPRQVVNARSSDNAEHRSRHFSHSMPVSTQPGAQVLKKAVPGATPASFDY